VLLHAHTLDLTLLPQWKDVKLGQEGSIRGSGYNAANKTDESEGRIRLKVKKIISHPLFTEKYDYDVALLQLEKKLDLQTLGIPPICLPDIGDRRRFIGVKAIVTGWGKPDEVAGSTTRILQKLDVPIIKLADCSKMMGFPLTERMLCAGYPQGGKDACMGDSGGPMISLKDPKRKQMYQLGIVSWGEGCARKGSPGIYTRVTDVSQWVRYQTLQAGSVWCGDSNSNA